MPVYEYEILNQDGTVVGVLEVEHKMSDPPLVRHPETGEPLRRVLSATFAHTSSGASSELQPGCGNGACGMPMGYGGCAGGPCGSS